jgi:protein-L-isoaspartate(D-aspartate) O-methyltransferase
MSLFNLSKGKEDLDFEKVREEMVHNQIIPRGIRDKRVLKAMLKVPRHRFVDEKYYGSAYADHPLPIGEGQTISQPYMVALMSECLELRGKETVLEVGTGSGYQAAILAELARKIYTIERIENLVIQARKVMADLNYNKVEVFLRDGSSGLEEASPFGGIMVTAASPDVPPVLIDQLGEGGRLVIPVGSSLSQTLIVITRKKGKIEKREVCGCVFVPLIGKYGWEK